MGVCSNLFANVEQEQSQVIIQMFIERPIIAYEVHRVFDGVTLKGLYLLYSATACKKRDIC